MGRTAFTSKIYPVTATQFQKTYSWRLGNLDVFLGLCFFLKPVSIVDYCSAVRRTGCSLIDHTRPPLPT